MTELLSPEELKLAARVFGVTEKGNFEDHSDPDPLPHQNVLSIADTNIAAPEESLLKSAKEKMFHARSKRVRPHLDDKVLASWNGLMLGGIARAYAALGEETYLKAARKNLDFLQAKLWDPKAKTLYHRSRDGERDSVQLLDAYAYLLSGVIELYQARLEPRDLEFAIALAESMMAKFYDKENGGFWQSSASDRRLRRRGTVWQLCGCDGVVETRKDYRPEGIHRGGGKEPSIVFGKVGANPASDATHAIRVDVLGGGA
jgi:uncharacterized protein YyaL (SSP411 family)